MIIDQLITTARRLIEIKAAHYHAHSLFGIKEAWQQAEQYIHLRVPPVVMLDASKQQVLVPAAAVFLPAVWQSMAHTFTQAQAVLEAHGMIT